MKKTCSVCGTLSPSDAKFCSICGTAFPGNEAPAEEPVPAPVEAPVQNPPAVPIQPVGGITASLKALFGSGRTLTIAILLSIGLLLSVLNCILAPSVSDIYGSITDKLGSAFAGVSPDFSEKAFGNPAASAAFSATDVGYRIVQFSSLIIPALLVLAAWLVFGAGKSKKNVPSTAGITILRVLKILSIIGICIAIALMAAAIILGVIAFGSNEFGSFAVATFSVILCIPLGLMVLILIVEIFVSRSLRAVKLSARSDVPTGNVSAFAGVMVMIGAILTILPFLFWIFFLPLVTLPSILGAVADIIFATMFFSARNALRDARTL